MSNQNFNFLKSCHLATFMLLISIVLYFVTCARQKVNF